MRLYDCVIRGCKDPQERQGSEKYILCEPHLKHLDEAYCLQHRDCNCEVCKGISKYLKGLDLSCMSQEARILKRHEMRLTTKDRDG